MLYFYFDRGLNQGGVWVLVFLPRGAFLTWFFVTFQCLRAELASKDAQLKVCACEKLFWYVDHRFGNDCSESKPSSTSVVCHACGTSAQAVPCLQVMLQISSARPPARAGQRWKIVLTEDQDCAGWLWRWGTHKENLADLESTLYKFLPKVQGDWCGSKLGGGNGKSYFKAWMPLAVIWEGTTTSLERFMEITSERASCKRGKRYLV